jgi:hypothetical protein
MMAVPAHRHVSQGRVRVEVPSPRSTAMEQSGTELSALESHVHTDTHTHTHSHAHAHSHAHTHTHTHTHATK